MASDRREMGIFRGRRRLCALLAGVSAVVAGCDPGRNFRDDPADAAVIQAAVNPSDPGAAPPGAPPAPVPGGLGWACGSAADCSSGFCATGRCCESACDGLCEACSEAGRCDAVPADDARCPAIECGAAGTSCVELPEQQATARCGALGVCKTECDPARIAVDATCEVVAAGIPGQCDAEGNCVDPRSAAGGACETGATCGSGFCVDGVCCNEACNGECESCDAATGSCVADPLGSACGDGLACFGRGACRQPLGAACTAPAECGSSFCEPATGGGSVCCEVDCPEGSVCNGDGACVSPESDLGQACASAGDCIGGRCVDGICCDVACDGPCERCNAPGQAGRCVAADLGSTDAACAAGETCAGRGQCKLPLGTSCVLDGDCASGTCGQALAGGEVCCEAACPEGQRCSASGSCVNAPRAPGAACTVGSDCASGSCVANRCCESACNGTCQACSVLGACNVNPGNDARCPAVDCPVSNTVCATYPADVTTNLCASFGACLNAQTACRPTFAGAGTACENVAPGVRGQCDGQGRCIDTRVGAGSACVRDTDCAEAGSVCAAGICRGRCVLAAATATNGSRLDQCVLAAQ